MKDILWNNLVSIETDYRASRSRGIPNYIIAIVNRIVLFLFVVGIAVVFAAAE